jgi:hypothetical protein
LGEVLRNKEDKKDDKKGKPNQRKVNEKPKVEKQENPATTDEV